MGSWAWDSSLHLPDATAYCVTPPAFGLFLSTAKPKFLRNYEFWGKYYFSGAVKGRPEVLPSFKRVSRHMLREGDQCSRSFPATWRRSSARKACLGSAAPPAPDPFRGGHSCWQLQSPAWDWQTDGPGFLGQFQIQMFFLAVRHMYCFLVQKLWSTLCVAVNPVSSCRLCPRKVQP